MPPRPILWTLQSSTGCGQRGMDSRIGVQQRRAARVDSVHLFLGPRQAMEPLRQLGAVEVDVLSMLNMTKHGAVVGNGRFLGRIACERTMLLGPLAVGRKRVGEEARRRCGMGVRSVRDLWTPSISCVGQTESTDVPLGVCRWPRKRIMGWCCWSRRLVAFMTGRVKVAEVLSVSSSLYMCAGSGRRRQRRTERQARAT